MTTLIVAVIIYLACTVAIGLYASSRVKESKDFMVAGRSLPFYMNFACVFATWFGAETLLSISATFANGGLKEVSGDPFGAAMCLGLVAAFFARTFYRMNLLTIGDFYHYRYGKFVEVLTSLAITISYVGWTSAQMTALGLVLWVLGENQFGPDGLNQAIMLGAIIVFIYTVFGGMWSVALTDVIQTAVIVIGLIVVATILSGQANGARNVITHAYEAGRFKLFPTGEGIDVWWGFIAAFLTFGLGSIPQQDVFQRVTSAKDESTAVRGTFFGGAFYFIFAFIPMFIAYSAVVIDAGKYGTLFAGDVATRETQRVLLDLILDRTPTWTQILFFGALLSAILSTASGTLLAPSSLFTENVIRPFWKGMSDKQLLWMLRTIMAGFAVIATLVAVNTTGTMYQMVQSAYKVTLVMAFVPLAFGVFWKRASTQAAIFASLSGLIVWLLAEFLCGKYAEAFTPEQSPLLWNLVVVPPQMYGLAASIIGMLVGGLCPQWIHQAKVDQESLTRTSSVAGH
jgi:solute:Na+ symporter, SSS family